MSRRGKGKRKQKATGTEPPQPSPQVPPAEPTAASEPKKKNKPGPKPIYTPAERTQRKRDYDNEFIEKATRAGQKIGSIPPVKDFDRKELCRLDFILFCRTYLAHIFDIDFCEDQLSVMRKGQEAVLRGGLFALAMPRGMGKTTICLSLCVWAIVYGHRGFIFLIGATAEHASEQLDNFRWICEAEEFDDLADDFPEVIFPIRCLEGESKKQGGQRTADGERTAIHWGGDYVVMPTVPPGPYYQRGISEPSRAAGSRIHISGITGRVRGFNIKKRRPDFVIPDDPQTDDSANSLSQCEKRERVLAGVAIGLAGPRKKIAGVMPCTVIRAGDMADNILNHAKHPEWDSNRTKLVSAFPKTMELWDKYRDIRTGYDPLVEGSKSKAEEAATLFYIDNQTAMDDGAKVAWEHKYNPDEMSAIQNAMNLFFQDRRAFQAEYQNDPMPDEVADPNELKADFVAGKLNGLPKKLVSLQTSRLTAFIDVQKNVLFYAVVAFSDGFTGYVVDYGTYPEQKKTYFNLQELTSTLEAATGVAGMEAQIYAGLKALTAKILGVEWQREDGTASRVERCLIDARWGESTDIVYQFCRESQYRPILTPSFGKGVTASQMQLTARDKKPGERFGLNWIMTVAQKRAIQHVLYDTNYWKSFLVSRWFVPVGAPGCLSLFGDNPEMHRMYADHVTAEKRVLTTARTPQKEKLREVDEWKLLPGVRNDWLDCTVGCAVAASMLGVTLEGVHKSTAAAAAKQPVSFAAMQRKARAKT